MEGGAPAETEVLARRIEFVEALSDRPLHKADLVEAFEHSRSTVNRAVKELEDAGLVERVTEGYVATQTGRLAAESYREFVDQQRSVLGAAGVLSAIPHDWDVPMTLLSGASVESTDPDYRLFELFAERTRTARECLVAVPELLDSRHLRVCHARVVDGDLDVRFQAPREVLTAVAEEFPFLWSELEDEPSFVARSGEAPPFGLVLWSDDEGPTAATLVGTDRDGIVGFVDSEDPDGVAWARRHLDSFDVDDGDVTGSVGPAGGVADMTPLTGARLPSRLRSEGFVRVDDRYFERHEPMDPTTAWRVGLDLPEVAAGYAVERTLDDRDDGGDPPTLTGDLVDRLERGENTALIGPPGAGKSTVCKSVACRWHESDRGPVFYRESGAGQSFESAPALETVVEGASGTALVVVEDAVRAETNGVFEVMRAFQGDADVVFLLDARESEWRDPEEFPVDARLRAFREEAVETVTMPPLVERDCERLVDRMESVTGSRLNVDVGDLLSSLRPIADADAAGAGIMPLLFHRLTQYLDPLEGAEGTTTLDEAVDRVRADLSAIGETALDAGVLVNALNAAGLGIYPEYVHAVATEDGRDHRDVRKAIARLEGEVLFESGDDGGAHYRGTYGVWSARFLKRLLDDEGEAAAERRFGRVLTAFLALADDVDRREAVTSAAGGDNRALAPVVTNPTDWASETVPEVFAVGRRYPNLAGLFGTTERSHLRLPEACPERIAARCTEWRGWMYARGGALDRADEEFRRLESPPGEGDVEDAARARLNGLLGRAMTARQRGDLEASVELAEDATELADELGDRSREAEAFRALGIATGMGGDLERARRHLDRSLEIVEEIDDRYGRANTLNNLGAVSIRKGELESAREYLQESLDLVRDAGDRRDAADRFINLALIARKQGDVERAEEYSRKTLEIYREVGDRTKQPVPLGNLGQVAMVRGEFEAARDYLEEAVEIAREVDDRHVISTSLGFLGMAECRLGDYDAATDHLEESIEGLTETGDEPRQGQSYNRLGRVALARGNPEAAREHFETAREIFDRIDDRRGRGRSLSNLGKLDAVRGEFEAARERLEESLETERELAEPRRVAETLERLGLVYHRLGDEDRAVEHLRESTEVAREAGNHHRTALSRGILGAVLLAMGDEAGREECEAAVSTLHDLGAIPDELRVRKHHAEAERGLGNEGRALDLCGAVTAHDVGGRHRDALESMRGELRPEAASPDERSSP